MLYRFKIKKNEYANSKLLFCSAWFKAYDSLEAIAKKDEFLATHPEYAGYYVTLECQKPRGRLNAPVLTERQVIEIKRALAEGIPGIGYCHVSSYLTQKYGVSRQTISQIRQGKTWKNV